MQKFVHPYFKPYKRGISYKFYFSIITNIKCNILMWLNFFRSPVLFSGFFSCWSLCIQSWFFFFFTSHCWRNLMPSFFFSQLCETSTFTGPNVWRTFFFPDSHRLISCGRETDREFYLVLHFSCLQTEPRLTFECDNRSVEPHTDFCIQHEAPQLLNDVWSTV